MTIDLFPGYSALCTTLLVMVFSSKVTTHNLTCIYTEQSLGLRLSKSAEYITQHGQIL